MRCTLPLLLVLLFASGSSADDKKPSVEPIKVVKLEREDAVLYDRDVEPILANKCQFCHSGGVKEGKLDMGSYEGLLKGGKRRAAIVPGKSETSLLIRLAGRSEKPVMPPKSEEPLTPRELALIKLWIDQGARAPASRREKPKAVLTALPPSVHPVRALVLSPDKSLLVAGRGNEIHVFDATSGKYVRSLINPGLAIPDKKQLRAAHATIAESLAYSPNGKWIASGSYQEVVVWDSQSGKLVRRLTGFADRVMALAFSPNSNLLATGGGAATEDGEIRVYEVLSGKCVLDIKGGHSDTVFGISFSPDGAKLATCSADRFVKTFEVSSGKLLRTFEGHTHHVLDVAWKADGKLLVSAGADNVIKVWDYEKGEQVRSFGNHAKQITRLLFKGKTPEIVTCSGDQTVRFWNVDSGGAGLTIGGNNDFLYALGISSDGQLVATGGEEGLVRLYNASNGQLVKTLMPPPIPAAMKNK